MTTDSPAALPSTMKAVVLKGNYSVQVEEVPVPELQADSDVLVQVHLAGLCGGFSHRARQPDMRADA